MLEITDWPDSAIFGEAWNNQMTGCALPPPILLKTGSIPPQPLLVTCYPLITADLG